MSSSTRRNHKKPRSLNRSSVLFVRVGGSVCVGEDACLISTNSTIIVLKAETKRSYPHNHTVVVANLQQEKSEQFKRN